ncbi:tautomerase family protein [bacterium RCC_150]
MPKVNIELPTGASSERIQEISDAVHTAMERALGTAPDDRFHLIQEYNPTHLLRNADGPANGQGLFVTFYLAARPAETMQALFDATVTELVQRAGFAPSGINLLSVPVPAANWWWDRKPSHTELTPAGEAL